MSVDKYCRVCDVKLEAGINWSDGQIKARSYICRSCLSEKSKKHYHEHAERSARLQRERLKNPEKAKSAAEFKSRYYAENKHKWAAYRLTQKKKEQSNAWHRAGRLITWVRYRAARNGWSFDLTREWAEEKLSKGLCEVTGLPFDLAKPDDMQLYPWAPSVDRIDSSKGYTQDNCRMVVWVFNMAKAGWSDDVVLTMARALINKR